jgi:hypothetical protein
MWENKNNKHKKHLHLLINSKHKSKQVYTITLAKTEKAYKIKLLSRPLRI